jgi:cytochrome c-type biogenesis protein CcmH
MTVPRPAIWILALSLVLPSATRAVEPGEILKDPALEARARTISKELRCVVCQNQSIDDSNATLARDLRVLVRERLTAGDSDDQAVAYIVDRYGDFVLLNPPFKASTWLLWLGPLLVLMAGIGGTALWFRRRQGMANTPRPLDEDEERRLAALLDDGGDTKS